MKAIPDEGLYDEDGEPIRRRRTPRPPNTTMYRLRDPVTGLFWVHSPSKKPEFGLNGKHWANVKSATDNWAEYNLQGALKGDDRPTLELVKFNIAITEVGVTDVTGPDMRVCAGIKRKFKNDHTLQEFARAMVREKFDFKYIMQFKFHEDVTLPPHIKCKTKMVKMRGGWSLSGGVPHPDVLYVGVTSETDLIYLKMAHSEELFYYIDVSTMQKIGTDTDEDAYG